MIIPFLDLKRINSIYEDSIHEKLKNVILSGWYILGKNLSKFEISFANYVNVKYCIGVGNGLDALFLLLKAQDFPSNSEIIVPANTFIATILAIKHAGLTPVLVEPDLSSYLIDVKKIESKINSNTKAILVTHLYGRCVEMQEIWDLGAKYKLKIFEDAAQAHGAKFQNKKAGNLSDGACFSFYPTKNLGALGDGGAICTNDEEIASRLFRLRNYGFKEKNICDQIGHNSRLDEIQAAILEIKLENLEFENDLRKKIAKRFLNEIKNPSIILPLADKIHEDVWHLFVIRHKNREAFRKKLNEKGIETAIHYPVPPHQQNSFSELNYLNLPITEQIHNEVISIPNAPYLTKIEVDYIIDTINHIQL